MNRQVIFKLLLLGIMAALPAAAQTPSATPQPALSGTQILSLLAGDVPSERVTMLVQQRGISFTSNDAFLDQVRKAGGDDDLVTALKSAKVTQNASTPPHSTGPTPPTGGPAPGAEIDDAKQEEVQQHAARGAELMKGSHFAEAETEYRAAVRLDPDNPALHIALSRALNADKKTEEGIREARLAIRLNPDSDLGYFCLGNSLRSQKNWAGAAREYREAIKLNPDYPMTHNNLGVTLKDMGDIDGAIKEYREALRLNPRHELAHANLGNALESKGDLEGAIAQYRELSHQRPRLPGPHYRLGQLLEKNGEPRKALVQFREAHELAPNNPQFKEAYERAEHND